jgi:integrase/recombinase XerC
VIEAIQHWLSVQGEAGMNASLFCALDPNHHGAGLTGTSIYRIVRQLAKDAGGSDSFSPHKIRHSAITALLDLTDGDLQSAHALPRHKSMDILRVYGDNRDKLQSKATGLLEQALK